MAKQTDHIGDINKMVTAVSWLIEKIKEDYPEIAWAYKEECQKAKAMEKEQITQAHLFGLLHPIEMEATKQAEQYYNETYNK